MLLLGSLAGGIVLTVIGVIVRHRRTLPMKEGDVLATLLASFGVSLAVFKVGFPALWTAVQWANSSGGTVSGLNLFPGSTIDDLLLAGAIGALASIVVAFLAYLNSILR